MAKYRGTVDGKQRGEYRSEQLQAAIGMDELRQNWGAGLCPFDDFDSYLSRAGVCLDRHQELVKPCYYRTGTYHYAGATVVVEYVRKEFSADEVAGEVTVKVVSNDPVDDVIEQLCRKFSRLKRNSGQQSDGP